MPFQSLIHDQFLH